MTMVHLCHLKVLKKNSELRQITYIGCVQAIQARTKDQEILEEGGGAGPSLLPRRDHE